MTAIVRATAIAWGLRLWTGGRDYPAPFDGSGWLTADEFRVGTIQGLYVDRHLTPDIGRAFATELRRLEMRGAVWRRRDPDGGSRIVRWTMRDDGGLDFGVTRE